MATTLIIGASGTVGSQLVNELDKDHEGLEVRLATRRAEVAEQWRAQGRDAVLLDLNRPEHFAEALDGVDRVFLLTGYTADMLHQSKTFVDAAAQAGVAHIVHLGVFSAGRHDIPHYSWHELIETYIEASGIAWTHLHPNVITDTVLATVAETGSFNVPWQENARGWVCAADIAAVAAAVLREGPDEHGGKNYWLSTEMATGPQVAKTLSEVLGTEITCSVSGPDDLAAYASSVPSAADRLYMESAVATMRQTVLGNMGFEAVVRDDVQTVLGRPGTTMEQWARENLGPTA
ncbi:MAG: NmrA family NAD(P)-binding protein [Streptomyces sp.]|nr:NmrA family NAD(P)-binding protein [Streptomyces sp.]NUS81211.1 NmrA family NAD(P)-binding protein [Streptomyces sp.]